MLFDFQVRAALRHACRGGDFRRNELTGENGYLLGCLVLVLIGILVMLECISFGKDVVAKYLIVIRHTGLRFLHVCPVDIVRDVVNLNARFDEFVDGDIHLELQERGNFNVTRRAYCWNAFLE